MERDGKRKPTPGVEEEELERDRHRDLSDEERKIEKFFEILKRLREARASVASSSDEVAASNKDAKKARIHAPVWTPVFQLEDFAGPEKDGNASASTGRSLGKCVGEGKEKEGEEKGLDLNLTL